MYDELVALLRKKYNLAPIVMEAADAIEKLSKRIERANDVPLLRTDAEQTEVITKLAAYEDAEEHGRLVILPCKVGDTVYYLNPFDEIESGKITMIQQKADGTWKFRVTTTYSHDVTIDAIGKTVFLNREEAEAAMKGEGKDV